MKPILLVGIGGFAGSTLRYAFGLLLGPVAEGNWPVPTFIVNVVGSILIGILFAIAERHAGFEDGWPLLLIVGFCGGFTTFSSFSLETVSLLQNGRAALALGYASASVFVCVLGTFLGFKLGGLFI